MKRETMMKRLQGMSITLTRAGVTLEKYALAEKTISTLDGVGLSKKVKWLKAVEKACIAESEHYGDMSPKAWANIALLQPSSPDLRRLRSLQKAIRDAFKS